MADEDVPARGREEPNATDLLDNLRSLRARVRADRHGYAFPLFLFAGLVLLAPLTYVSAPYLPDPVTGAVEIDQGAFPQFVPRFTHTLYPGLVGWYWVLAIVGGMAVTGWWYRRRAHRLGVETDTRIPFAAAGAALAGFLLWQPVFEEIVFRVGDWTTPYSTPWLNLPVLFGSALAATAVLAWTFRPQRTDRQRTAGVFTGVLLASLTFAAAGVYMIKGFSALFAIAAALLVLAWLERSALLAVVGTLFTLTSIPANHFLWEWDFTWAYERIGWTGSGGDARVFAVQNLLLPGLILLAGGAVAALARSRSER